MSKFWNVRVSDEAYYPEIEAETEEQAMLIAQNWFMEREPEFEVEEVSEVIPDNANVYLVSHYISAEEEVAYLGYVAVFRKRNNAIRYSLTNSVEHEDYFLIEEKPVEFARAAHLMGLLKD